MACSKMTSAGKEDETMKQRETRHLKLPTAQYTNGTRQCICLLHARSEEVSRRERFRAKIVQPAGEGFAVRRCTTAICRVASTHLASTKGMLKT